MARVVLALVLGGCTFMDVSQPIALVSSRLSDEDAANLEEAGHCWNLKFGTQFVTGDAPQQVEAFYDEQTCLTAVAQVQAGWPARLAICPEKYWDGILEHSPYAPDVTSFSVMTHELGHTLNIIGHPDDPYAVMRGGPGRFGWMFTDADVAMLVEANPDFAITSPCKHVMRSIRPGTQGRVAHCACEIEENLDLARPIVLAMDEIAEPMAGRIRAAARCFDMRYGTSIELRAPQAGDQIAYIEPSSPACSGFGRARDGNDVLVCAAAPGANPTLYDGMSVVGYLFGLYRYSGGLFDNLDRQFASMYPGRGLACTKVAHDGTNCICND